MLISLDPNDSMMAAFDTSKPGESPSFFDGDSEDGSELGREDAGFDANIDSHVSYEYDDPNDWEECRDDVGNVFWYQISTGESRWEAPVFGPGYH